MIAKRTGAHFDLANALTVARTFGRTPKTQIKPLRQLERVLHGPLSRLPIQSLDLLRVAVSAIRTCKIASCAQPWRVAPRAPRGCASICVTRDWNVRNKRQMPFGPQTIRVAVGRARPPFIRSDADFAFVLGAAGVLVGENKPPVIGSSTSASESSECPDSVLLLRSAALSLHPRPTKRWPHVGVPPRRSRALTCAFRVDP